MKQSTLEGLIRYAENHCPPGGFLYAVLANDLREATGHADKDNLHDLPEIVSWCQHNLPWNSWGNEERVYEWLKTAVALP